MSEFQLPEFEENAEVPQKEPKGGGKKKAKEEQNEPKAAVNKKPKEENKVLPKKTDMEPGFHRQVGFVSQAGILFPCGYKFPGGFIGSRGNVVLNKCPECKNEQYPAIAVKGVCEKLHEKKGCGFNMIAELEEYEL